MINNQNLHLKEKFDPALISALYQNFSDPIQAILELVDNAVDDMLPNRKMVITVDCNRDSLCIVNKGGTGMGMEELKSFFVWGKSNKRGKLGRYGQGGKAAMGYLGRAWRIKCNKRENKFAYIIEESNWDDRTGGLKEYKPKEEITIFEDDGVVQIDIKKLKKKINKNELRRTLSKVYRPLIKEGRVEINSPGLLTHLDFPLEFPEEYFGQTLSDGSKVGGWVSLLERGSPIRGGIRCYVFGRLIIEREFFGQKDPTYKESIDRLIGELYIEDENLPLLINKSDIDRGSPIWEEIEAFMYKILEPYIDLLLEEKDKDTPTEKEKKISDYAGDIWAAFLKSLRETSHAGGDLSALPGTYGQKPIERNGSNLHELVVSPEERKGPYDPATPPPPDAIGKRKRTGSYLKPVPKSLHETVRYELGKDGDTKVIFINTRFPLYKIRMKNLPLYIWETLAMEYALSDESDSQNAQGYLEEINRLIYELGTYLKGKKIKNL